MNEVGGSRFTAAASWAVPLRVIVGYGFIAHGLAKLSRGPDTFAAILQALGVPAPELMAWATILVELLGGFAVVVGAFVWLASIPMAVVLLVAMFTVHLPYGFSSIKLVAVTEAGAQFGPPGYEANLLYLAALAALVLGGSGPLSLDARLRLRRRETLPLSIGNRTSTHRGRRATAWRWCIAASALSGLALACPVAQRLSGRTDAAGQPRFKAVAFDYFVLFNPDSIVDDVERIFPGRGRELTNLWRTRQFEYTWLRSLTGRYVDFAAVTEDALVFATKVLKLALSGRDKQDLLDAYLHLTPWPDTADALRRLRQSGVRVITIANFSPTMLRANAEHSGLLNLFDALISTDSNHTYKPDPRAYRLGMDRLHLPKEDILFVAFGGWDAAGAKSFGYTTYWVNRFNQPMEELGVRPDRASRDLNGLLEFVREPPVARP